MFDARGEIVTTDQEEFPQIFPRDGWVEHDPEAIWESTVRTARAALREAENNGGRVAAIGITNQRETAIVWERDTGRPIHNAIVWQDRRTAEACRQLAVQGLTETVQQRTGLLLDPYFSATKVAWILDHVDGARDRAERGELAFGTVDAFLIWRLTGGRTHATDATNAARTSLFSIHTQEWDPELLEAFRVPSNVLPEVRDSSDDYAETDADIFGRPIPILGVAGDQQAAAFGQCCFAPGDIKSTYGTGCFVLMNTGDAAPVSEHQLLATVAYRLDGKPTYALEGSIFSAGSTVQWLRDGLGIIERAEDSEGLASGLPDNGGVYLVPAFTGLGAPWWDPDARAAIVGMGRATGRAHLARAALESVCYQTRDLFEAMADDGVAPAALRVDGGMVANDWMLQFLADILAQPVDRPRVMETTALGAAYLAGMRAGIFGSLDELREMWQLDQRFEPKMPEAEQESLVAGWRKAVGKVLETR